MDRTYKTGDIINLNHEYISLKNFDYGHTHRVEIKLGRKSYLIDVYKNNISAFVEMYPKTDKSKYSTDLVMVQFKPNAMIDRRIMENSKKIEDAQTTLRIYGVGL